MLHITNKATSNDSPVPERLPFHELSRIREVFDLRAGGISPELRNEAIFKFRHHEEVVLWFEQHLHHQIQFLQILDWFGAQDLGSTRQLLICTLKTGIGFASSNEPFFRSALERHLHCLLPQ